MRRCSASERNMVPTVRDATGRQAKSGGRKGHAERGKTGETWFPRDVALALSPNSP
jgi:hypothetical protein